ncbi:MAG: alpha/beta hydrolase [Rhodospirillaceae bacterium]|nr:MAG: alpha/beta hydrolase [Rhodospirillaceae bacterium]
MVVCAAALILSACSTVGVLNALAPVDKISMHQGVAYEAGPRHQLDIYAPAAKDTHGAGGVPVVVFFYGGGWTSGDRSIYRFLGAALAARGVMVVVPDYRLYPEVKFPAYMYDAAAAVAWTRAHAAEFGGDPGRIFIMGHSAGGQIAGLLALNDDYLKSVGLSPADLAGMIGLAGPYDFLPLTNPVYKVIFGPEDQWPKSQPITYANAHAPPMLLVTGSSDDTVSPGNTQRLSARLRGLGDSVDVKVYPHIGHVTLMGAFSSQLAFLAPVRDDVLAFIAARTATASR